MRHRLIAAAALCLALAGCGSALPRHGAPQASATHAVGAGPASSPATVPGSTAAPRSAPPGSAATGVCGAQPARQALLGSPELIGVQFVSATQGWAVGLRQILTSTDGGHTWSVQDHGSLDLTSVDFIDSAHGWAVGASSLLQTLDGRSWTALPEPCPLLRSVHFVTPAIGFAIAGGSNLLNHGVLAPEISGELLATSTGGHSWSRLAAPPDPQTVCFSTPDSGWLGAAGRLYRSTDGGRTWALAATGPRPATAGYPSTMFVQCAGASSVWAVDVGQGAAMSKQPHIGYHGDQSGANPIFAEQFFPHPGVNVTASAPGSYAGPLSAISGSTAVFIDWCPACGLGAAQWDLATDGGASLATKGTVGGISQPTAASFLTPLLGWVVGVQMQGNSSITRIVRTRNGGLSWQVQWTA